ncbi:hypothetical protein GCM10027612_16270 [Microbispora bryophytorum subsp. camponoti]
MFMAVGGLGTVLTAAYFLAMLSRVTHGRAVETVPLAGPLEPPKPDEPPGTYEPPEPVEPVAAGAAVAALDREGGGQETQETARPSALADEGRAVADDGRAGATGAGALGAGAAVAGQTGGQTGRARRPFRDVTAHELAAWLPLVALIVLFGLWPKALLAVTTPAVQSLLGSGVTP